MARFAWVAMVTEVISVTHMIFDTCRILAIRIKMATLVPWVHCGGTYAITHTILTTGAMLASHAKLANHQRLTKCIS